MELQRTPEWYAARKGRITGSNAGAAMGLNPYKTADDLIRQMVRDYHGAPSEFTGNQATDYGTQHEMLAIMAYAEHSGTIPGEAPFVVHPEHDWLGASPDGIVDDEVLVEIKCPFGLRHKMQPEFKTAAEQPHYYAQMQVQMACTGAKLCDFFQWAPFGTKLERVPYDPAWFADALPKLRYTYNKYLAQLDNPEHLQDKVVRLDTHGTLSLLCEYDRICDELKALEDAKKATLQKIVEAAGGRSALIHGRKLTLVERKGNVNYSKIPELKYVDLEPYRGQPTTYWKL